MEIQVTIKLRKRILKILPTIENIKLGHNEGNSRISVDQPFKLISQWIWKCPKENRDNKLLKCKCLLWGGRIHGPPNARLRSTVTSLWFRPILTRRFEYFASMGVVKISDDTGKICQYPSYLKILNTLVSQVSRGNVVSLQTLPRGI